MGFIGEYWRGEKPLWKAFWLWGLCGSRILALILYETFPLISPEYLTTTAIFLVFSIALKLSYWIWVSVSIWRCARNSYPLWRFLSRLIVLIPIIGFIVGLTFATFTGIISSLSPADLIMEDVSQFKANKETQDGVEQPDRASKAIKIDKTIYIEDLQQNEEGMIEIPKGANIITREKNGN